MSASRTQSSVGFADSSFQKEPFPLSITVCKEEKWYVSIHLMEVREKCALFAEKTEGCRLLLYASGVFTADVR